MTKRIVIFQKQPGNKVKLFYPAVNKEMTITADQFKTLREGTEAYTYFMEHVAGDVTHNFKGPDGFTFAMGRTKP